MPTPTPAIIRYPGYKKTVLQESTDESFDAIGAVDESGNPINEDLNAEFDADRDINLIQNEIRFHAVISEDHKASSKITKFPVQTGFEISNHAIKQNRVITLEGIFSNTILEGSEAALQNFSGSNISKTAFEVLESLVQSAAVCTVITNLGIYTPVVFTNFSTKQEAGMVDSIKVTIKGEEIQVAETVSRASPKELVFTEVPIEERAAIITKLTEAGIGGSTDVLGNFTTNITPDTLLSTAKGSFGEDFSITNLASSGAIFDTTFISTAWDGVSEYTMDVFTSNTDVFSDIAGNITNIIPEDFDSITGGLTNYGTGLISGSSNFIGNISGDLGDAFASGLDSLTDLSGVASGLLNGLNVPLIPNITDLSGAFNGFSNCLLGGSSGVIKTEAEKFIDTAMGRLDRSIYGAKMDIIQISDNKIFQSLIGSGLDCVAAAGSDVFGAGNANTVDEVVDEMIVGIKGYGDVAIGSVEGLTSDVARKALDFIKIESPKVLPLQEEGQKDYYVR